MSPSRRCGYLRYSAVHTHSPSTASPKNSIRSLLLFEVLPLLATSASDVSPDMDECVNASSSNFASANVYPIAASALDFARTSIRQQPKSSSRPVYREHQVASVGHRLIFCFYRSIPPTLISTTNPQDQLARPQRAI